MKTRFILLAGLTLLGIFPPNTSTAQSNANRNGPMSVATPKGFVLVPEHTLVYLHQTPATLIDSAKQHYSERNYGNAGMDLGEAAILLKAEAKRAPLDENDLNGAADRLQTLARKVARGGVKSDEDLREGILDVFLYAARHHRMRASEEWAARETKAAGHDLLAAADATERAAKWTGNKIQNGTMAAVKDAREAARKLIAGSGWGAAKVSSAISSLGTEVERLATRVEPKESAR